MTHAFARILAATAFAVFAFGSPALAQSIGNTSPINNPSSGATSSIVVGTTVITNGTPSYNLYDKAGVLGASAGITCTDTVCTLAGGTLSGTTTFADASTNTSTGFSGLVSLGVTNPTVNTTALTVSGYSLTGSDVHSAINITGTLNTSGTPNVIFANITNTACSSIFSCNLINLEVGGASKFNVTLAGSASFAGSVVSGGNVGAGNANALYWGTHAEMESPVDATWELTNASGTQYGYLSVPSTYQFQIGQLNSGTPVAQTISFQGGSGTNTAGVNTTIDCGGASTGTATSGNCLINYWVKNGSSGSGAATATLGIEIAGETGAITFDTNTYTSCTALTTTAGGVVGCTASDERLKNDLGIVAPADVNMPALHKFTFKTHKIWIDANGKTKGRWGTDTYGPAGIHYGWFAQDVQKRYPELVHVGPKTALTPNGTLQFDKIELDTLLIAKQQQRLDADDKRFAMLDKRITVLEHANDNLRSYLISARQHHIMQGKALAP